jgi:hypothetical protein
VQARQKVSNEYTYETAPHYGQTAPKRAPRPKTTPRRRQKVYKKIEVEYVLHPKHRRMRKRALQNCIAVLFCFVMLSGIVAGHAYLSSVNLENVAIEKNIEAIEADIEKANMHIATGYGLNQVAEAAEDKLYMQFPDETQIKEIELKKPKPIVEEVEEEPGFFSKLWQGFLSIFG